MSMGRMISNDNRLVKRMRLRPHVITPKARQIFIAMLAFLPWFSACADDERPPKPPFFVPFEAQKAGSVFTTELRVVEHRSYIFSLALGAKKGASMDDVERIRKLAGESGRDKSGKQPWGGKLLWPGIPIPVKLKVSVIESSGQRIIYDKEIHEMEKIGVSSRGFIKLIDSIELKHGLYRIDIQSLKDIPELDGSPITFGIYGWPNSNPID
jgi:hypothetical protein